MFLLGLNSIVHHRSDGEAARLLNPGLRAVVCGSDALRNPAPLARLHVPASDRNAAVPAPVGATKPTRDDNMPIFLYLPFIIATGMLSIATDSMRVPAKQESRAKNR
jgi:hypothetical protein